MKVLIDFRELHKLIKLVADDKFEGNFSMAVRFLIVEGLKNEN